MRIYIAAPFELRDKALEVQEHLEGNDHFVTSTWIKFPAMQASSLGAAQDLCDIDTSEMVLLINPKGWESRGTGGRHFECGYAWALGKQLVILGVISNVFHHFDGVRVIEDISEL